MGLMDGHWTEAVEPQSEIDKRYQKRIRLIGLICTGPPGWVVPPVSAIGILAGFAIMPALAHSGWFGPAMVLLIPLIGGWLFGFILGIITYEKLCSAYLLRVWRESNVNLSSEQKEILYPYIDNLQFYPVRGDAQQLKKLEEQNILYQIWNPEKTASIYRIQKWAWDFLRKHPERLVAEGVVPDTHSATKPSSHTSEETWRKMEWRKKLFLGPPIADLSVKRTLFEAIVFYIGWLVTLFVIFMLAYFLVYLFTSRINQLFHTATPHSTGKGTHIGIFTALFVGPYLTFMSIKQKGLDSLEYTILFVLSIFVSLYGLFMAMVIPAIITTHENRKL